jgi:hypothetical protein
MGKTGKSFAAGTSLCGYSADAMSAEKSSPGTRAPDNLDGYQQVKMRHRAFRRMLDSSPPVFLSLIGSPGP